MFMKSKSTKLISFLAEEGYKSTLEIPESTLQDITVNLIRETPTKLLPFLEDHDKTRDILTMLAGWMETEDEEIGRDILDKLRNCAVTAFEPDIDEAIKNYNQREELAQIEARRENAANVYADNRQRI